MAQQRINAAVPVTRRAAVYYLVGFVLSGLLTACTPDEPVVVRQPAAGEFIDYGYIPAAVDASQNTAEFQTALFADNSVFVATSDGIWKNDLTIKRWSRTGLEGKIITALYQHPTMPDKFFAGVKSDYTATAKTLYLSTDGGTTWQAANQPIFSALEQRFENYVCFAVRPGNPQHVYAGLDMGTTIAVSTDGGQTWVRQNKDEESFFGYGCPIAFLPGAPNTIYQGAESPLDFAWLGQYDVNSANPVLLSNFSYVVNHDVFSNRRPNQLLTTSYTGKSLYIGQEGALSKVTDGNHRYLFKSEGTNFPYSYVYAIWIDPHDTRHLLFGGSQNGGDDMNLYETYDEGATTVRFTDKLGLTQPNIREIVPTNTYPAILINDDGADKVKLYLYRPTVN